MRPRRLIMEGFLAYRQRTEVDFTDADLFVLSGPTGSGKSSVIDGMTFALYGTIPRLDDRRSVAPVISAMSDRARVSFEFTVGDETYTAVRLVTRTRTGATTSEARLERGDQHEVLAGNADDVTSEVGRLLGLSYEHFTKAVVLPQGDFAQFLTDRPADRQALLRALLEIGLFEQVMQLANSRARIAETRAQALGESLAKLEVPTPELLDEARNRLKRLGEAVAELPARGGRLSQLEANHREVKTAQAAVEGSLGRLAGISPPPDLDTLDRDRVEASDHLDKAGDRLARVADALTEVDEALAEHPGLQQLEAWQADRERLRELTETRAALDFDGLSSAFEEAALAREEARAHLDRLRVEHAAHDLRRALVAGDPCPVCHSVIAEIPGESELAHGSIDRAMADVAGLDSRAGEARDRLKEAEGQSKQIGQRLAEIEDRLGSAPSPDQTDAGIVTVRQLLTRRSEVEQEAVAARADLEAAQSAVNRLSERTAGLRETLLAARDRVAAEEPPLPGDDVVAGWRDFELWRLAQMQRREESLVTVREAVEAAAKELSRSSAELEGWLQGLGVEVTGSPETDLALAKERQESEIRELERTVTEATELAKELEVETTRARVAASLGTHLRSNNFEAWLLEEAMDTLIDGANRLLEELSGGAYSLLARDAQFVVVDHRNAGLIRTTRGLSGGETFLVALSLALSMAEQLAELTGMSSRLESVLLDEGFGSLDQESLDVVASVLDDLVGKGRTVGIVTHVRELADRMPVRFEVTKGPETASIEKVMT